MRETARYGYTVDGKQQLYADREWAAWRCHSRGS